MRLSAIPFLAAALLSACATSPMSGFAPESLHRVQVYAGAARPEAEVATLFTMDGRPHGESATMCDIDGVSLERDGVCASVAYVLPGWHVVQLRYSSNRQVGSGIESVRAEAGRLYQINFSSLGPTTSRAAVSVIPMYPGARLSWRNLAPGLAAGSPRIDEPVPYAADTALAAAAPELPLSPDERAIADRLVACAAAHAFDIDVLKADHRLYDSAYAQQGAFLAIAQDYLHESGMRTAFVVAQARARRDYGAGIDAAQAGSPEWAKARDHLASDLLACEGFRQDHLGDFRTRHERVRQR